MAQDSSLKWIYNKIFILTREGLDLGTFGWPVQGNSVTYGI